MWTPLYCPDTQPIELFWAAGKNHVALHFDSDTTMKDVVQRLRDGWYGNTNGFQEDNDEYCHPIDCNKLVMDKVFVPLCTGLSGSIGNLTVDPTHEGDTTCIPIDTYIVDLTKDDDDDVESHSDSDDD